MWNYYTSLDIIKNTKKKTFQQHLIGIYIQTQGRYSTKSKSYFIHNFLIFHSFPFNFSVIIFLYIKIMYNHQHLLL